ncbi:MAG: metal-dependent hydrolase [Verrucomicrobia bacterium]|nr:metal-dependent hydrolase [Verrucomicrobiota bacterium]
MDPVTHALLGAATSYALFGRKLGRRAAMVGFLAGIAPDIDNFVSSKEDVLLYVEYHRGFTHSIPFAFLGAFIVALPWILQKRFREQWKTFWLCAFPAYLSHCLLDASTTYGTQLFWPFTRERFGWDFVSVVDPMFTIPLGIALFIGLIKQSRKFVAAGLIFCAAYLSLGAGQRSRAASFQAELAAQRGHKIERSEVMPTLANLMVWRSLYLEDGQLYSDRIRVGLFGSSTYREGTSLPLITAADLTPLERRGNEQFRGFDRFAWFSDGWVARSPFDETVLGDMRYSLSTEAFDPVWGIRFNEESDNIKVEWVSRQLKRDIDLRQLWSEIVGTHPGYGIPEKQ